MKTAIPLAAICALLAVTPAVAQDETVASLDPRVKFKDGGRLLRDLSASLELPRESVCVELGQYDCNDDAFRVVLGGVDPYVLGIDEPLENATLTGPIAVDRVALNVCATRVAADLDDPASAVLLKPGEASEAWKSAAAEAVYGRILRRDATGDEVSRLVNFYETVDAGSQNAQRDWVTLSCFAVASSLENLFY